MTPEPRRDPDAACDRAGHPLTALASGTRCCCSSARAGRRPDRRHAAGGGTFSPGLTRAGHGVAARADSATPGSRVATATDDCRARMVVALPRYADSTLRNLSGATDSVGCSSSVRPPEGGAELTTADRGAQFYAARAVRADVDALTMRRSRAASASLRLRALGGLPPRSSPVAVRVQCNPVAPSRRTGTASPACCARPWRAGDPYVCGATGPDAFDAPGSWYAWLPAATRCACAPPPMYNISTRLRPQERPGTCTSARSAPGFRAGT